MVKMMKGKTGHRPTRAMEREDESLAFNKSTILIILTFVRYYQYTIYSSASVYMTPSNISNCLLQISSILPIARNKIGQNVKCQPQTNNKEQSRRIGERFPNKASLAAPGVSLCEKQGGQRRTKEEEGEAGY